MPVLTDVERLALKTLSTDKEIKESRDGVVPGKYKVDMTLHIKGEITVAPDTEAAPSAKLASTHLVAMLLKQMGHTRESGMALIASLQSEFDSMAPSEKKTLLSETGYNDAEGVYKAGVVASLGKSVRRGSVKGDLSFDPVKVESAEVLEKKEAEPRNKPDTSTVQGAVDDIFDD